MPQRPIHLMAKSERPSSEIAMELGIRRNQLYKWKDQLEKTDDVDSSNIGRPRNKADGKSGSVTNKNHLY